MASTAGRAASRPLPAGRAPGFRRAALGASVALIAALVACSSPSGTRNEGATPTAASNDGLGDAPAPTGPSRPAPATTTAAPTVVTEAAFASPSGNIGCYLTAEAARCDIAEKSWSPPPAPASCTLDWGFGVTVGRAGEATFTCAGDTVLGAKDELEYGRSLKAGPIRCDSESTGMRCENTTTGHGFRLAKEKYDLF
ncbi:DUF6636 domain-containing protein [Actinoplanes sp. NPDC049316]|uniref:DUF6636 domain-containing protein n=1 Tax=Actinoplanes sp. NPDC049316 TaxID=3154727 RepID=UPI0034317BC8